MQVSACAVARTIPRRALSSQFGGPSSIVPATSLARPIAVIDAKPPAPSANHDPQVIWVWGRVDTSIATIVVSTPTANYTPTITDGLFVKFSSNLCSMRSRNSKSFPPSISNTRNAAQAWTGGLTSPKAHSYAGS